MRMQFFSVTGIQGCNGIKSVAFDGPNNRYVAVNVLKLFLQLNIKPQLHQQYQLT